MSTVLSDTPCLLEQLKRAGLTRDERGLRCVGCGKKFPQDGPKDGIPAAAWHSRRCIRKKEERRAKANAETK